MTETPRSNLGVSLLLWTLICFCAGAIGAAASVQAGTFYAALVRPGWAPPASVFGPVWTVLYGTMAVAAALVWTGRRSHFRRLAIVLFALQLILNALWSWLFFAWHQGALAFMDIVLLWLCLVATVVLFWGIRPVAGMLLVPYLAWVSFAAALNYSVWQLNPSVLA
jgi:benzodiazapine receptor